MQLKRVLPCHDAACKPQVCHTETKAPDCRNDQNLTMAVTQKLWVCLFSQYLAGFVPAKHAAFKFCVFDVSMPSCQQF